MSCQLQAMKSAGIRCVDFNVDDEEMLFANGVVLPVLAYYDSQRERMVDEPIEGGWAEFGTEEVGFGWYPIHLVHEENLL